MKIFCGLIFFYIFSASVFSEGIAHSYLPKEGFVSSEATAKLIAEAVLVPIYGKESIAIQKPFKVRLKDNIWIVEGSMPSDRSGAYVGGNFTIHISKNTGEILRVTHGK